MVFKVVISELAVHDLDQILDYMMIKLDNRIAANAFADEIERKLFDLASQPKQFALSNNPYLRERGYRKCVIDNYIMIYRVNDDKQEVIILRFFYGRQDYAEYI